MKNLILPILLMNFVPHFGFARNVVIAVIDTGLDTTDPLFKNRLWINAGETGQDAQGRDKSMNGIDDDGNGYADDVHGWDFAQNSGRAVDHHGHGTHISGIIIRGESPSSIDGEIRLMTLKYFGPLESTDSAENSRKALRYAIDHKADIINYSGGGPVEDPLERQLLQEAERKGILVIAAAGNNSSSLAKSPYYPASYGLKNILSVAAHGIDSQLLPSSNYGPSVDLVAPGYRILSNAPGGEWARMSGTSQATAFVTSTAAQIVLQFKAPPPISLLKELILQQTETAPQLRTKVPSMAKLRVPASLWAVGSDLSSQAGAIP